jgi:FG-GAP-like repeat
MMLWLSSLILTAPLGFSTQRLAVDGRVVWVDAGDINRDGAADLVSVFRRGAEPDTKRFIGVFYQQADGRYPDKPSEERPVPADAAVATVADCDGDNVSEVVFLTSAGVSAYMSTGGKLSAAPVEWVKSATATYFPEPEDLPLWDMCGDFHKTGKPELAMWETGALSFHRFSGGKWQQNERLKMAPTTLIDSMASGFFRGASSNRDVSISALYIYPELAVGDYDGDGRADLFAIAEEHLRIYAGNGERYSETPTAVLDFNLRTTEERNLHKANVSAQALDINGDKKTDFVLNKVAGGLSSMKSETAIHINKGGFSKKPDKLVKRNGFSALTQFADLDRDGRPEMIEPYADVGLVTLARAMVSKAISVDWLVTKNHDGVFDSEHPTSKIPIRFGLDFSGGPIFKGPFPRISHDFDGDGLLDFLASPDGEQLEVYLGKKEGFFDSEPAVKVKVEVSPFTTPFYDAKAKKTHVVTFFRDVAGKEGRIVVMLANP